MSDKKNNNPNGKHLTEDDRALIAEALQSKTTLKDIGKILSKDPTTIAKEIKANRTFKQAVVLGDNRPNLCVSKRGCQESYVCNPEYWGRHCYYGCRKCPFCNEECKKFEKEECLTLKKAPYVCNGCGRKKVCRLEKYYYRAVTAQRKYEQRLSISRMGINIGEEECMELDNFITPLIKKGQPISHIYNVAGDRIPCSKSTLYRYINSGILSVKNIDLRSLVRYKPRRGKTIILERRHRKNRTYLDFLQFMDDNSNLHVWEMDIVEGRKGGKALLTIFSRDTKLMLIFLLEGKTQNDVLGTLYFLEEQLGQSLFFNVFQVMLTDNDPAFLNAVEIETSRFASKRRSRLFYCDPYSSYQKGGIEKNHEYIRWVLPKGKSFDALSWNDVALLASHINSVARDSLNGLTPYEAMRSLNPSLLNRVYLTHIPAAEVTLTPGLLK
jgi:IS30 family transposase